MPHAVVAVYFHPKETFPQQQQFFDERILPMVRSAPGFQTGLWGYDPSQSHTYSHVVFDSEANAQKLAGFMKEEAARPNPFGVTLVSITTVKQVARV
jgi:hypothetical protein